MIDSRDASKDGASRLLANLVKPQQARRQMVGEAVFVARLAQERTSQTNALAIE